MLPTKTDFETGLVDIVDMVRINVLELRGRRRCARYTMVMAEMNHTRRHHDLWNEDHFVTLTRKRKKLRREAQKSLRSDSGYSSEPILYVLLFCSALCSFLDLGGLFNFVVGVRRREVVVVKLGLV